VLDVPFVGASAYPIEFVFTYRKGLALETLQRGLDRVLPDFPLLAGEITYDGSRPWWSFVPQTRTIRIEERGEGGAPLDSVVTLPGEPLLKIVLRRGAEHDTLGVSMSHAVADGFGYFSFLSAFCAVLRGDAYPRPDHDRRPIAALTESAGAEERLTPDTFFDRTGMSWLPHDHRERLTAVSYEHERLPPPEPIAGVSESATLAAVSLRWWVQGARGARAVRLSCAVDLRRRVTEIDPHYFGNASYGASCRWSRSAYDALSDAAVAQQIHAAVRRTDRSTAQRVLAALRSLLRDEGLGVTTFLRPADPAEGILVTNLSRIPLANLDCGVGCPLDFAICTRAPNAVVLTRKEGALYRSVATPLTGRRE
jgi:hypothetical protein